MVKVLDEFISVLRKYGIAKAARKSGIYKGTLYQWTSGRSTPSLFMAGIVAEAIGMELVLKAKEEKV